MPGRKIRRSSESGSKYSFGAMNIPTSMRPKSGRPLLISPFGPPKPWSVKTKSSKFGNKKLTSSGYLSSWLGQPIVAPPSWNPLLLQDGSTFRMGTNQPKLSNISSFGKKRKTRKVVKKPSKVLRTRAKKLGVRVTLKRGNKRVYKSEKVLKKQIKSAIKRKKKSKKKVTKRKTKRKVTKRVTRKKPLPYLTQVKARAAAKRLAKRYKRPTYLDDIETYFGTRR